MTTNDILRRLGFALKLNDRTMLEALELAGSPVAKETLDSYFKKDDEEGFAECPRTVLAALLDGLILRFRGARTDTAGPVRPQAVLDNNAVLKKIRIALSLKEDDLLAIMRLSGMDISKNELTALFRDKGHKNYKECMDQFLRNFLVGLAKFGPSLPLEKD